MKVKAPFAIEKGRDNYRKINAIWRLLSFRGDRYRDNDLLFWRWNSLGKTIYSGRLYRNKDVSAIGWSNG